MFAMRRALRKWSELPRRERRVLVEAALLLLAVHVLQQALPFRRWRALLTRPRPSGGVRPDAPSPDQIAQAVERARRTLPGDYKCLPAAYTGHLLLHRHGYASAIQVGVAHDAKGQVEAHAWVEACGRILIGALPDLERFVPFPPLEV
ncbi:MAG TPA: lasso peptide biosynthesis B2 protein [Polyangiaceae bacterium]|nr:lasso peptide biosynthesis B2 protein [Polyangiaceae bacterium]